MLRLDRRLDDSSSFTCKDSKSCVRLDTSLLVGLYSEKISPIELILGVDPTTLFHRYEDENEPSSEQMDIFHDIEACFDSELRFPEVDCTKRKTKSENDLEPYHPPWKKQKRRDSLAIFQSMVDDGDLDFENDNDHEEQSTFSNSDLSLTNVHDTSNCSYKKIDAKESRSHQAHHEKNSLSNHPPRHPNQSEIDENNFDGCDSAVGPLLSLQQIIKKSQHSYELLTQWDNMMGLKKCHARTMNKSEKSRKKLLKLVTKTIKKLS